ncbi:MAG: hypothetical protein R2752_05715 [Vicinamibacterales bacterium]
MESYATLIGLPVAPAPPCLSLYQVTHRGFPESRQDRIRFRHLVSRLEQSLLRGYRRAETRARLEPFRALESDDAFWIRQQDGLAVLGSSGHFQTFSLRGRVPELAIVADTFHVKPLLREFQSADRFQILSLTRSEIRLYEGNRDAIEEIEPAPGVPRTLTDALGTELTEAHLTVASYGGAGGAAMHHGHHSRKDEVEVDADRFFRVVDRSILERHSRPGRLPLLLVALPEHQARFRSLSRNRHLLEERVDADPGSLGLEALRQRAWQAIAPRYEARLDLLTDQFHQAAARQRASARPEAVARAAVERRVETLLIDAGQTLPGRVDPASGRLEPARLDDPHVDDVLDDLAELVLAADGDVLVVPSERMPAPGGCAAIFRF